MHPRSIHDNRIISYEVDGHHRRIVLRTRFEDREPFEDTNLRFEGVLAYHFAGDNLASILFGVEEISIPQLVEANRRLFEEGFKYSWPGPWNRSIQSAVQHLEAAGGRAFEIASSYGLAGWVVAESYCLE